MTKKTTDRYKRRRLIRDLMSRITVCAYPFHKPSGPGKAIQMLDEEERELLKDSKSKDFQIRF